MTDREKLIELIEQTYYCSIEELADHLIANGVTIATDNNVGDKTNADRIRAMSDEELHDLLVDAYNAGVDDCTAYAWGNYKNSFEWTEEWLKQPVETENADRCVCCGAIIPEGQMVCPNCLVTVKEG